MFIYYPLILALLSLQLGRSFQSPRLRPTASGLANRLNLITKPDVDNTVANAPKTTPTTEHLYTVSSVTMADMFRIMSLCGEQFGSSIGFPQYVDLQYRIVKLFLPKFVFPDVLQHKVIGLRTKSGKLAAFADVSLQPSSGTTDALMSRSYNDRLKTYGSEKLNPYLCNFLVAPEFRRQGLGKQLLRACEEAALSFGKRDLYLHVEKKELPALCLYLGSGFESLPIDGSTGSEVVFMRKVLKTSQ